jgi:hypothetical protein
MAFTNPESKIREVYLVIHILWRIKSKNNILLQRNAAYGEKKIEKYGVDIELKLWCKLTVVKEG